MTRLIYTVLMHLAIPAILFRLWRRGATERGYRHNIGERFGGSALEAPGQATIWVHAVSVGEVRAAMPLIGKLMQVYPSMHVVLTCMTPTGRATARDTFTRNVTVQYLPYDLPWAYARFIRRWRPAMLLVMETELWPNLLAATASRRIPAFLANARLSEKSRRGYARPFIAGLAGQTLRRFKAVLAQSEADAARIRSLGTNNVIVTGNVKFDMTLDHDAIQRGLAWRAALGARPVVLLASTRDNEETPLIEAFKRTFADRSDKPFLVVVPRHPSRFDDVCARIENAGLAVARRSTSEPQAHLDAWLGDSMGEMQAYYAMCDVAVIGGSFQPLGGQNLIEAAAIGRVTVMGPSTFNFAEAVRLAGEAEAMVRAEDTRSALRAVAALLDDTPRREAMADNARAFAAAHAGATARTLDIIESAVPGRKSSTGAGVEAKMSETPHG